MPRIRAVQVRRSATAAGTAGGVRTRGTTAATFGAGIGDALQDVAGGLQAVASAADQIDKTIIDRKLADAVAQSDFTGEELGLRGEVGPDAAGYTELVGERYDAFIEQRAEQIDDNRVRDAFMRQMQERRAAHLRRAAQYEAGATEQHSRQQAGVSLDAVAAKIRTDPDNFDLYLAEGEAVINARPGIGGTAKETMRAAFRESAARQRFNAMVAAAQSPAELDQIEEDLRGEQGREWTRDLGASNMNTLLNAVASARRSLRSVDDAEARSALGGLEERASSFELISEAELADAQSVVARSPNPNTRARMARIVRDQSIIRESRHMSPDQMRERLGETAANVTLPPTLDASVADAASRFDVPASYLAGMIQTEYGVFLDGTNEVDYGKGTIGGTTSAVGVAQFTKGTFLRVMRSPGIADRIGVDISGMSEAKLLDLRKDPAVAVPAAAALAELNKAELERNLGREVDSTDIYAAHLLGANGAAQFLNALSASPEVDASGLFSRAAKNNPGMFQTRSGKNRTVAEVYRAMAEKLNTGTGFVQHGDNETRKALLDKMEQGLKDDPVLFAQEAGRFEVAEIVNDEGIEARGEQARSIANFYGIPVADMQPFTQSEAQQLSKYLKDGDADRSLRVLAQVQAMGPRMSVAALKQLNAYDPVRAYAGGLQFSTGQGGAAGDVLRGQTRIENNPDIMNLVGADRAEISQAFLNATGGALLEVAPGQRQSILDAATAHYVETQATGASAGVFNSDAFALSVQAVMGATQGAPALGEVNGAQTALPPGTTAGQVETAIASMEVADWALMSPDGDVPRYVDGTPASAEDLREEARLRAIGGGRYVVEMSDGSKLTTGRITPEGRVQPFVIVYDTGVAQNAVAIREEVRAARQGITRPQGPSTGVTGTQGPGVGRRQQ